jgi:hypothetical protein
MSDDPGDDGALIVVLILLGLTAIAIVAVVTSR